MLGELKRRVFENFALEILWDDVQEEGSEHARALAHFWTVAVEELIPAIDMGRQFCMIIALSVGS